jgi:hypothetical protein
MLKLRRPTPLRPKLAGFNIEPFTFVQSLGGNMKNTNHTALLVAAALLITGGLAAASLLSPGPMPPPDNQKLAHDIFKEIVQVRSVHDVGTKGVADILVRYLKAGGFTNGDIHVLAEEKYPNQVNVVVRLTGKGKGRPILWHGHMDGSKRNPRTGHSHRFNSSRRITIFMAAERPT